MEEAGRTESLCLRFLLLPKQAGVFPAVFPSLGSAQKQQLEAPSLSALLSFGSPLPRSGDLGVIVYGFPANAV